MLPKTLTPIKSYAFDSTAIKTIFYLETTQMTCKNKILDETTTETKNIRVKRESELRKRKLCSNREITIEKQENMSDGLVIMKRKIYLLYGIEGISQ